MKTVSILGGIIGFVVGWGLAKLDKVFDSMGRASAIAKEDLMAKHYTQATLEDGAFCKTCNAFTPHAVSGGRLAHCIPCFDRRQKKEAERKALEAANPTFAFAEALH